MDFTATNIPFISGFIIATGTSTSFSMTEDIIGAHTIPAAPSSFALIDAIRHSSYEFALYPLILYRLPFTVTSAPAMLSRRNFAAMTAMNFSRYGVKTADIFFIVESLGSLSPEDILYNVTAAMPVSSDNCLMLIPLRDSSSLSAMLKSTSKILC